MSSTSCIFLKKYIIINIKHNLLKSTIKTLFQQKNLIINFFKKATLFIIFFYSSFNKLYVKK